MAGLQSLNELPPKKAREAFLRCCGSAGWVQGMLMRRPFKTETDLFAAADEIWQRLSKADFLEAFARHPRIGGKDALRAKFAATLGWAQGEQAGAREASEEVLEALSQGNAQYEKRFGYIFIVCATGKSAAEMLALLHARLPHSPDKELAIAAGEQAKITALRLKKLLES
ncbi:MAG: 2-oxo-4-hydroxy-4-carboxy-5-ureidoimidazoline decarboxylase [Elusimicrobia bacterium]|nr:2-oxo-4-hydroxy-4-carboxy-5-ureidoimidazoline decarboxylase [Elusimicrobiota bacterium]